MSVIRFRQWFRLLSAAVGAIAFAASGLAPSAWAAPVLLISPPVIDPGVPVPVGPVGPLIETEQHAQCARPMWSGPGLRGAPEAQRVLDLPAAWRFSRGSGQTVAIIDTGVSPHPRLPTVIAGGDFVSTGDGTDDCDGHGSLVAGIVGARPSATDGFSGVAPDASIIAIRQLSLAFEPKNSGNGHPAGAMNSSGYGNTATLARAIVQAVKMHATVIDIGEAACVPAGEDAADGAVGVALELAYDSNVVVVASAGNLQTDGPCKDQNDGIGWAAVKTVSSPAWYAPFVLSVASVDADGSPSAFSLNGPWVSVAAPGRGIVSLDSAPGSTGLVNSVQTSSGPGTIDGTAFAGAYVAGLAALVRAEFPSLSARGVMDRIVATAHHPGSGRDDRVGAGTIDPLAALTAQLPGPAPQSAAERTLDAPRAPSSVDPHPRRVALTGLLGCAVLGAVAQVLSIAYRRNRRRPFVEDVDY
ncbi:type VII secretion-associated serine protease mycosin [Nocardia sp. CDC160]|uniref:type VII secretion-associated serine protease mycosin n=1 Tax=Nocardia sp. CDC160 TaxID=3112166 RepID=UPI002DB5FB9C|nr:type VII secretion-associated serine protease mycosin [Nocardia sp. CDC160]MEC3920343.1 type VII secretion-associated serine protease mycosin [Nocardia sp. CDC160]